MLAIVTSVSANVNWQITSRDIHIASLSIVHNNAKRAASREPLVSGGGQQEGEYALVQPVITPFKRRSFPHLPGKMV